MNEKGRLGWHSYSSKSYVSVDLSDSMAIFLEEGKNANDRPFLYYVLLYVQYGPS